MIFGVVYMKKILIISISILFSLNANAAFYLKTNEGNKLTVSKDLGMAVYTKANGEFERYTKDFMLDEKIDNQGRPYISVSFTNDKCLNVKNCKIWSLGMKSYNDKMGGANILFFDQRGNVMKTEYIAPNDMSMD